MLPILYLRGLSTGDFAPALRDLLGEDASGLSASSIGRLTEQWQAEHERFRSRSLKFHRYAYLFVDGVHMSVRLGEDDRVSPRRGGRASKHRTELGVPNHPSAGDITARGKYSGHCA